MFTGEWLAANWLPLVIVLAIGFVLGWLILGLPPRRKSAKLQTDISDLETRLQVSERSLADSRQREPQMQAALQSAQSDFQQASDRASAAERALAEARQSGQGLQADLDASNGQVAALQQQLVTRDGEVAELKLQVTTLRSTVQQAQQAFSGTLEPLQEKLQAISEENANLKANLEGLSADMALARADNQSLTESLANKETALTEAYARAVRLQREVTEQQNTMITAQTDIATLKRSVNTLTASNNEMGTRLQDARGEVAGELAVLTSTMLRAKDDQLAKATATIEALYAQLNEREAARPVAG